MIMLKSIGNKSVENFYVNRIQLSILCSLFCFALLIEKRNEKQVKSIDKIMCQAVYDFVHTCNAKIIYE